MQKRSIKFASNEKILQRSTMLLACLTLLSAISFGPAVPTQACPCHEIKAPAQEPKDDAKLGLEFAKTKEYDKEFAKAVKDAKTECSKHIGEQYVAIVSDIDETILDNRPFFEAHKEFKWPEFFSYIAEAKAPSLKQTTDLLAWARKNGFAIFLVTGRPEKTRAATIQNLVHNGIEYDALYMRPNGDKSSAVDMKTKHRKAIQEMGFHIVVNIGDQLSDLLGGQSVDCEKLPNKIYYVP